MYGTLAAAPEEEQVQTKLTVRLERRWVEAAKGYASRHGTTLSRLIEAYLRHLPEIEAAERNDDTPILRRLRGVLPPDASVEQHREHLVEKYLG